MTPKAKEDPVGQGLWSYKRNWIWITQTGSCSLPLHPPKRSIRQSYVEAFIIIIIITFVRISLSLFLSPLKKIFFIIYSWNGFSFLFFFLSTALPWPSPPSNLLIKESGEPITPIKSMNHNQENDWSFYSGAGEIRMFLKKNTFERGWWRGGGECVKVSNLNIFGCAFFFFFIIFQFKYPLNLSPFFFSFCRFFYFTFFIFMREEGRRERRERKKKTKKHLSRPQKRKENSFFFFFSFSSFSLTTSTLYKAT